MVLCKSLTNSDRGNYKEKNDCSVRAYHLAAEIPYANAHAELFVAGRKVRHGFNFSAWADTKGWQKFPKPNMTVETYIKTIAYTGRWIINIRGHVFAVIDGVINDMNAESNLNRHVILAWKVK